MTRRASRNTVSLDHIIEEGDIIFRLGYGVVSYFIDKKLDPNEHISHVGMITKSTDKWEVIHAIPKDEGRPDGTQIIDLDSFISESKNGSIQIIRPNYQYFDKEKVLEYLAIELNAPREFDLDFNMSDSTKIYCIELIWKALYHGNKELKIQEIIGRDFCELLTHEKMKKIEIN